jgi:hypothetical protein
VNRRFYQDDAYIVLRYVQNALAGRGAVWNPGEYVQGYTSFLHFALLALVGGLGVDLVFASRALGVAAYLGLVAVLCAYLRHSARRSARRGAWQIPFVLVSTSAPLVVWSLGGLETVLVALCATAGCVLLLSAEDAPRQTPWLAASGACFALAFLTRPDASLLGAAAFFVSIPGWRARGALTRDAAAFALPIALLAFPYVAWELCYYGDFVPNSFHAKIGSSVSAESLFRGVRYLASYSLRPPFLPLLAAAALVGAVRAGGAAARELRLAAIAAAYTAFIVVAGGDGMSSFRLVSPLVPLLALIVYGCAQRWSPTTVARVTALVLALSYLQLASARLNPRVEDGAAKVGTIVGRYIEHAWPEGSLVALNTAGSTPFFATRMRYVDMLGLNDRVIAERDVGAHKVEWQSQPGHIKGDGAYVLERAPDFIILGPAQGTTADAPMFLSDFELAHDPRFAREYELVRVRISPSGGEVTRDGQAFVYYRRIGRSIDVAAPAPSARR